MNKDRLVMSAIVAH